MPGGSGNQARGNFSFAAGLFARAIHSGTFVWADAFSAPVDSFVSTGQNQFLIRANGGVGIGTNSPNFPLEMASGAHVTAGGVWTDASSRAYKENITNLNEQEAISALLRLNPVRFNYKAERDEEYVGFIAEEVPALVATKDRKSLSPMDIVAILTKVVQVQQKNIVKLQEEIHALKQVK